MSARVPIDRDRLSAFCRKWRIREFALFGSVLREDFGPGSDVDVLVTFEEDAPWNLWHIVEMKDELKEIFGREVDLLEKRALRNPFRKREILQTHEVIYAA
jgi:hypothetical protein